MMLKKLFGKTEIAITAVVLTLVGGYALAQAPLNPALTAPHSTPTGTTCTIRAGSTDYAGECSATATSGVAIAFSVPFNTAPFCVVKDRTTASGDLLAAYTASGFTMGTTVSADKISWICQPAQGG